jgi:hypothetical protein
LNGVDSFSGQYGLNLVRTGKLPIDDALHTVKSEEWLNRLEPSLDPGTIERVIFTLLGAPWSGPEALRVDIAHWAAQRCLAYRNDEPRRLIYFFATVLFSLKGSTTSAVRRLRAQDARNDLREERKTIADLLHRMAKASPPWIRGRIRSVVASLSG